MSVSTMVSHGLYQRVARATLSTPRCILIYTPWSTLWSLHITTGTKRYRGSERVSNGLAWYNCGWMQKQFGAEMIQIRENVKNSVVKRAMFI